MKMNFYYEELFAKRMDELAELRYRDIQSIHSFFMQDADGEDILPTPVAENTDNLMKIGDIWQGRNRYIWLSQKVHIPQNLKGRKLLGIFDFGKTGGGTNSGFEALLYVNKKRFQAVDMNHTEIFWDDIHAGCEIALDFYLWSGLEGGGKPKQQTHQIRRADIGYLDEATDSLYFWTRAILGSLRILDDSQPEKHLMVSWLKSTYQMVDYTDISSDDFYQSIAKANQWLEEKIAQNQRKIPVHIHTIGHTHIDLAWLWQLKHTREKAIRSFSTVDQLMKYDDEYIFFHSTPQLYDYVKKDCPELYSQIKQRVKEGRWEVGGAMWVEADCNVISGESLTRQFLYGTRFFEQEFGVKSTYLWLPDVFGYSWAMPQVLKQCEIDVFYTTKISWNEHNRMPYDSFSWSGVDGSEVLVHFITVPELDQNSWLYTYNGQVEPETVMGSWLAYTDKAINQDLLLAYGYGDGGGGVNRHMLEMRRKIDKIPAMPTADVMQVKDYTEKLKENLQQEHNGYIHRWDNELYLEYHRGTYTSQAEVKKQNRKLELALKDAEFIAVLSASAGDGWNSYPQPLFESCWKTVLRNQFHDIIPGSSITEVYEDTHKEYKQVWQDLSPYRPISSKQIQMANSSNFIRSSLFYQAGEPKHLSYNNTSLTMQKTQQGCYYFIPNIPPMSMVQLNEGTEASIPTSDIFIYQEQKIETPYYLISWNEQGQLTEIWDKQNQKSVLTSGGLGNFFEIFEDKPRQYDAWEMEITINDKKEVITNLLDVKQVEMGALFTDIEFQWQYNRSTITQNMRLYAHNPRIDFITNINWQERDKLLKTGFTVDIRSTMATYDIQYGHCQRPTHHSTSWDHAKFEVCAHQWADLSEFDYGVALLNDCKYGYDIYKNQMRLTLLKSAQYPDPTADLGEHHFTYSLLPHKGSLQQAGVIEQAWDLNNPLYEAQNIPDALLDKSLFFTEDKSIMIDAVKKAEDENALIIRMHEAWGQSTQTTLRSDFPIASIQACNMLEKPQGESILASEVKLNFKPFEIKNFIIHFKN